MFTPDEPTTIAFREMLSAMSEHAPRVVMTLPSGATEKAFSSVEKTLGAPLPDALKALYIVHHGEGRGVGHRPLFKTLLFRQTAFLPLTGVDGVAGALEQTRALGPWIPFGSNGAGTWHGIMPDDHETDPGAIILHDMATGTRVVARTMVDFLNSLAKKLKRKRWKVTDDHADVVVAKLYASECLPFDHVIPHPDLLEHQIQLIRVNVPEDEETAFMEEVEATVPEDNPQTWRFLIDSLKEISAVQIIWRDDANERIYPCRSTHSVRRVQGRSQREYIVGAPLTPVAPLHMEVRVEYTPDSTT